MEQSPKQSPAEPLRYAIEHDGFVGTVIGQYTRLDGKRGVVMQQDGTNIVHVYGEKWLKPALPIPAPDAQAVADKRLKRLIRQIKARYSADPSTKLRSYSNRMAEEDAGAVAYLERLAATPVTGEADVERLKADIEALTKERAAFAQQPVAWLYQWRDVTGKWSEWKASAVDPNDWAWPDEWKDLDVQPLYATPSSEPELMAEIVCLTWNHRDAQRRRAEAAESRVEALTAEVGRLTKERDEVVATSAAYNPTEREAQAIHAEAAAIERAETAKAEAFEEAAQIADGWEHTRAGQEIADAIRSRAASKGGAHD